jgi:hypothetical protein
MSNLRILPVSFVFSGSGGTLTASLPVDPELSYKLISVTEYHSAVSGTLSYSLNLQLQGLAFPYFQNPVYQDAIFSVDPTNSLTEAKFRSDVPIFVPKGSGVDVTVNNLSGAKNNVELAFQALRTL